MLVDTVIISPKTSTAEAGSSGSRKLTVNVEPADADNVEVTYSIDTAEGLEVNSEGLISWAESTPAGVYTTTVETNDGGGAKATHKLTLTEPEPED